MTLLPKRRSVDVYVSSAFRSRRAKTMISPVRIEELLKRSRGRYSSLQGRSERLSVLVELSGRFPATRRRAAEQERKRGKTTVGNTSLNQKPARHRRAHSDSRAPSSPQLVCARSCLKAPAANRRSLVRLIFSAFAAAYFAGLTCTHVHAHASRSNRSPDPQSRSGPSSTLAGSEHGSGIVRFPARTRLARAWGPGGESHPP